MNKFELTSLIPCDDNDIVYVVGKNAYYYIISPTNDMTWKELIEKCVINRKERRGAILIIVEHPLSGEIYQFGNCDRDFVYEHGKSNGYA